VPRGEYAITDGRAAVERFMSAPGPMGWRYHATRDDAGGGSTTFDVSVDRDGRPVRVRIESAAHTLTVIARGERFEGERDGELVEGPLPGPVVFGSPGSDAVLLHRLASSATVRALRVDPATLTLHEVELRCERRGDEQVATPAGMFDAARWRTGGRTIWLAGSTVVAADGVVLRAYEPGATGPVPRLKSL